MHRIVPSSDPTHRKPQGEWKEVGGGRRGRGGRGGVNAKRSVLLLHGLLDSGATWLLNGRNGSLALWLADRGFDVWLGNSRGNMYSTSHEELLPSQPAFWNWSWDEMAKYDLPALISCVQRGGGPAGGKIAVVAHSQGTLQTFASLALPIRPATDDSISSAPPLSQSISVFVALAPVAYVAHLTSPLLRALSELRRYRCQHHTCPVTSSIQREIRSVAPTVTGSSHGTASIPCAVHCMKPLKIEED
jgi:pimeloyl-ACP methyl ester carboxylesterase